MEQRAAEQRKEKRSKHKAGKKPAARAPGRPDDRALRSCLHLPQRYLGAAQVDWTAAHSLPCTIIAASHFSVANAGARSAANEGGREGGRLNCLVCKKSFKSAATYETHVRSGAHKKAAKNARRESTSHVQQRSTAATETDSDALQSIESTAREEARQSRSSGANNAIRAHFAGAKNLLRHGLLRAGAELLVSLLEFLRYTPDSRKSTKGPDTTGDPLSHLFECAQKAPIGRRVMIFRANVLLFRINAPFHTERALYHALAALVCFTSPQQLLSAIGEVVEWWKCNSPEEFLPQSQDTTYECDVHRLVAPFCEEIAHISDTYEGAEDSMANGPGEQQQNLDDGRLFQIGMSCTTRLLYLMITVNRSSESDWIGGVHSLAGVRRVTNVWLWAIRTLRDRRCDHDMDAIRVLLYASLFAVLRSGDAKWLAALRENVEDLLGESSDAALLCAVLQARIVTDEVSSAAFAPVLAHRVLPMTVYQSEQLPSSLADMLREHVEIPLIVDALSALSNELPCV